MKKGQQYQLIATLIIMVMILGMYYVYLRPVKEKGLISITDETCMLSVRAAAEGKFLGFISRKTSDFRGKIICPPKDTMLKGDIESKRAQRKARSEIAMDMAKCWRNYGRGKLPLFEEEGIFCGICSWVEFSEKEKEIEGMKKYLATRLLPENFRIAQNMPKGSSFADYLANAKQPKFDRFFPDVEKFYEVAEKRGEALADTIDTTKLYAVNYVYFRGEDGWTDFITAGGATPQAGSVAMGLFASSGTLFGAVAIMIATGPIGWTGLAILGTATFVVGVASFITSQLLQEPPAVGAMVMFNEYDKEMFDLLQCEELVAELG